MSEKSVGRGVIILAISSIVLKLLSALYVPFLKEIITEAGFAIYTVAYKLYIFLLAITSLGIQPAITKVIAELRAKEQHNDALKAMKIAKKYLIIFGGIISILLAITAIPLSIVLNRAEISLSLFFLSPAITLAAVLSAYRGYFQGYNEMNYLSVSNIIEQVFNVVVSLVFAFLLFSVSIEFGSAGGTFGTSVGAVVSIIYIRYIFRKKYRYHRNNIVDSNENYSMKEKDILRRLIRYAIPIMLVSAVQNVSPILDNVLIGLVFKENINTFTARLEYFNVIVNVPLVIVTALGIAVFPKIIKSYYENDKEELKIKTEYCYKLIYIVIIPAICGLMILSKDIFKFVFTESFGYELLILGSVVLIFMSIASIQNIILQGMNKFRFVFKVGVLTVIIKLIFNIIFMNIDNINIMGAIIGSIGSFIIIMVMNHIKIQQSFGVKVNLLRQSKLPLIASIVMSFILIIVRYFIINNIVESNYTRVNAGLIVIGLVCLGGLVYGISLLFLGGITRYELDTISPNIYKYIPKFLRRKIK